MSDDIESHRIAIVPTQTRRSVHAGDTSLTIRRTLSIRAPPSVQPSARLPIEFRTLSLHLENSKAPPGKDSKAPKGTVKGWFSVSL
jgi:hypothetical protein